MACTCERFALLARFWGFAPGHSRALVNAKESPPFSVVFQLVGLSLWSMGSAVVMVAVFGSVFVCIVLRTSAALFAQPRGERGERFVIFIITYLHYFRLRCTAYTQTVRSR